MADDIPSIESRLRKQRVLGLNVSHNETAKHLPSVKDRSVETEFISELYLECAERLSQGMEILKRLPPAQRVDYDKFREVEARFRLFGGSFDHGLMVSCLDDVELFDATLRSLLKVAANLKEHFPSGPDVGLDVLIYQSRSIISTSEDDDDSDDSDDSEQDEGEARRALSTERGVRGFARLSHSISMLMELLPILEAANRLNHPPRVDRTAHKHLQAASAAQYVRRVRDKFPKASPSLADRLGEANWQRHERLRDLVWERSDASGPAESPGQPMQKAPGQELSWNDLIHTAQSVPSISGDTSISAAPSEASTTKLEFPKMPEGATCPYCGGVVEVDTLAAWKLHVYSDLQAYICTHEACPQPTVTFDAWEAWAQHELDDRLTEMKYECSICSSLVDDKQGFLHHVDRVHSITVAPGIRQAVLANAQRRVQRDLGHVRCNLCLKHGFNDKSDYTQHVGSHLEDIALAALPQTRRDEWSRAQAEPDSEYLSKQPYRGSEKQRIDDLDRPADSGSMLPLKKHARDSALSRSLLSPASSDDELYEHKKLGPHPSVFNENGLHFASLSSLYRPSQDSSLPLPPQSPTIKATVKAPETVRYHTSDVLVPEGDEFVAREMDDAGEKKIDHLGYLQGGRDYRIRTFTLPGRGQKLFMLATECARQLQYRDSYLLFNKNRSLYKIIASAEDKEGLISQEILPYSYRSRQIAIVTARSMYRQFGSRVVKDGRRVLDDYWESKARKQGFTEADAAGAACRRKEARAAMGGTDESFPATKALRDPYAAAPESGVWSEGTYSVPSMWWTLTDPGLRTPTSCSNRQVGDGVDHVDTGQQSRTETKTQENSRP
ncbi:uncharacterized protein PV07_07587 [Cladophialophora immunda]|uniref:C2H2-type domain-containing protein n=1 Tax=Cladophialophora immunda TaxID=569365 RepID=A0A0D2CW62_9EURO|nr:uncharacterized protein PV07_07587 [Cladophialophora immunda]KIW27889.1 hypothetical protein PV07_07587 [Cladophialophora immunda]OQV01027.1 hypothetical protein CLAIMM_06443 isoform 1 [Cladophialophora immunda]OQV01028.1 hypothetical protein CLAIMM_06443 isoform 2 [Cladophialophora immunda]